MIKKTSRESLAQTINRIDVEQFKADYSAFTMAGMQLQYQISEPRYFELAKLLKLQKYRARKSLEELCVLIPKDTYVAYVQDFGIRRLCEYFDININQAKALQNFYGIQLRKRPQTYEEFKNSIDTTAFIEYTKSGKTDYSEFLGTKNNRFINRLLEDLGVKKRKSIDDQVAKIDVEQFKADFASHSLQELADIYGVGGHIIKQLVKQHNLKHTAEEKYVLNVNARLKAAPDKTLEEILSKSAKMANKTKQEKGTSNTSSIETFVGRALKARYGESEVSAQYYTKEYPFCCDFYVHGQELFIEVNGHFTHGHRPFNKNSTADMDMVAKIKQKQDYYISASGKKKKNSYFTYERVWTKTDPKKMSYALKNKLKYIMIYMDRNHVVEIYMTRNIEEFKSFEDIFKDIFRGSDYKLLKICYLEDYLSL